jgi:hypothetical protein
VRPEQVSTGPAGGRQLALADPAVQRGNARCGA